ncbi:MAG: hypothetical protein V1781_09235 [Bacteroidota bacterium]
MWNTYTTIENDTSSIIRAVPKIDFVIATARHEAGSNLYFYIKKQIASVVPPSQ